VECRDPPSGIFRIHSVVLLQNGHPLAYISKPLGPKTRGLSIYEKEYLAILLAVDQWRQCLQLAEFIIFTDQKSLVHLNDQRLNTPCQKKVFSKLLGLQYKLVYKKGADSSTADALSRRQHSNHSLCALSAPTPLWFTDIAASYKNDQTTKDCIAKLAVDKSFVP
jgi:hypothetical protein